MRTIGLALTAFLAACSTPQEQRAEQSQKPQQQPLSQRDCVVQTGSNLPRCTPSTNVKTVSGDEFRRNTSQPMPSIGRGTP